jgi:tetratricopeptide (TPR) repeat protein
MKPRRLTIVALLAALSSSAAFAQAPREKPDGAAAPQDPPAASSGRADAYYNYTMGHIYEQQYENSSKAEYATQAIEFYKKAYALDPKSAVIGERLAEMYWKAQRVHDAVSEAQEILKRDPNDVPTRRLLARIYVRSLGDSNASGGGQSEIAARAIEQYKEIYRLEPSDTESALWLARLYRLRNEHDKAEGVLRGILKLDPDSEPAIEQLTQLLLDEGKSSEAVSLLEGMTSRAPSPVLLDLLGDAYTQTKELAKAEASYRKAMEMDPSELSHVRGLGQTLMAEEKFSDALVMYQKLADLMPDEADNYLHIAQISRELHQLDKAEENLLKARQYEPGSLEIMYNEAMVYQAQGRYDDAIRVVSDAVSGVKGQSLLPSRRRYLAILYQELGQLYKERQNYAAAVYTYEELGHLGEEEDRRSRLLLMDTYRASKDLTKALQTGKDALVKYPADPAIRSSQALLLGDSGQTEEAVKMLRTELTKTDADRDTYLNIAQVYERGRRYQEAEQAAHAAEMLPGQPRDNAMVWALLGAIYERQKFFDRAEDEFKKALAVDPKNAFVLNYYGYMLGDLGQRLDEAEALVQRALQEEPFNGGYLDSLGWIYYKQNNLTVAETTLRKALERESHDPTIHSHLGDVYAKLGRNELAATEWEKSLSEWRRSLPAEVENDKIAEIEKKLGQTRHRVAQKSSPQDAKPQ